MRILFTICLLLIGFSGTSLDHNTKKEAPALSQEALFFHPIFSVRPLKKYPARLFQRTTSLFA